MVANAPPTHHTTSDTTNLRVHLPYLAQPDVYCRRTGDRRFEVFGRAFDRGHQLVRKAPPFGFSGFQPYRAASVKGTSGPQQPSTLGHGVFDKSQRRCKGLASGCRVG